MKFPFHIIFIFLLSCKPPSHSDVEPSHDKESADVFLTVLGTLQDGGMPHAGCNKSCCKKYFEQPDATKMVTCLGIVDLKNKKKWMIEATPDFARQMKRLKQMAGSDSETPDGIFITHAHLGHYSGLMYLGREAMNSKAVRVYVMPRMKNFLENNGPWSQLVSLKNIELESMEDNREIVLSPKLKLVPLLVPHRDEFSETVGFLIQGQNKKVLFVPDINKWKLWNRHLDSLVKEVDLAFIDGTFYDEAEINHRNISEIPHPFVIETLELLKTLSTRDKSKIRFIHFNHTNPLNDSISNESGTVIKNGFGVAHWGMKINL